MQEKPVSKYRVIGLMSGTSLDGVDIAVGTFHYKKMKWSFSVEAAKTFAYTQMWQEKLKTAHLLPGEQLLKLHVEYGEFLGQLCNQFIKKNRVNKIDLVASHGHTIFHQPKNGFTFQLGDGFTLHSATGLPVACDFRSQDVALGGEGAPLVPIGDTLLFPNYNACLNLGGIANVSFQNKNKTIAFDICFCNLALNHLSAIANKKFDANGELAKSGTVDKSLLQSLQKIYSGYRTKRPSLAREDFEKEVLQLLNNESISVADRLRTVCEAIAEEIAFAVPIKKNNVLLTGGGAHNRFLVQLLRLKLPQSNLTVPDKIIVDFKEALVFAFLGVLRLRGEINVLKSVTGSKKDSCSGIFIR
ncbi:MAG: anhydro-N-acetylmuramic acid kinase [Bacteroidetes bacterium]|nr:anhydro-N-acetylmuramic acid kinase [Bacteroidota bacterium]